MGWLFVVWNWTVSVASFAVSMGVIGLASATTVIAKALRSIRIRHIEMLCLIFFIFSPLFLCEFLSILITNGIYSLLIRVAA